MKITVEKIKNIPKTSSKSRDFFVGYTDGELLDILQSYLDDKFSLRSLGRSGGTSPQGAYLMINYMLRRLYKNKLISFHREAKI